MTEAVSKYWVGSAAQTEGEQSRKPILHLDRITRSEWPLYLMGASAISDAHFLGDLLVAKTELLGKPEIVAPSKIPAKVHIEVRGDNKDSIAVLLKVVNFLKAMKHHNLIDEKKSPWKTRIALREHAKIKTESLKRQHAWEVANQA